MMALPYIVHLLFTAFTVLLFLRIISSWFPLQWQRHRFVHFLSFYTDPYLNVFRRIIPPIGGMLDLSPVLGFFALKIIETLLLGVFR